MTRVQKIVQTFLNHIKDQNVLELPADAQNSLSVRPRMPSLFTALI